MFSKANVQSLNPQQP